MPDWQIWLRNSIITLSNIVKNVKAARYQLQTSAPSKKGTYSILFVQSDTDVTKPFCERVVTLKLSCLSRRKLGFLSGNYIVPDVGLKFLIFRVSFISSIS